MDLTLPINMDIQPLRRLLPHRDTCRMVDRVVECVPGCRVLAYSNVIITESFLSHTLGLQVMPSYLLLEALAQAAVVLTFKTLKIEPSGRELMFYAGIDDCGYAGAVHAGDRLDLRADIKRMLPSKGIGIFEGEAKVSDLVVVRARLIAALRLG